MAFSRPLRAIADVAFTAALALWCSSAMANGRFPQAAQLVVDPTDDARIVVRTTFGPLQSLDAGKTWRWTCEKSVGYSGTFDPALAITTTATLLGLPDGVSVSDDHLCTFAKSGGPLAKQYVIDLAVDATDRAHVVAVTNPADHSPGFQAAFTESRDGGHGWKTPVVSLPEDLVPLTVDLAPSHPQRLYISGVGAFPLFGVMARSDDGGATWSTTSFDMHGAKEPYVTAIDPSDENHVFLRLKGDVTDRLVVSRNGATTFDDGFIGTGALLGAALSPDGKRIAIGGPSDGLSIADATASTLSFTKVSAIPIRCLTWTKAGLFACSDDAAAGFVIGLSHDEGKTFSPLLRFADLLPLACAKGTTTGDFCAEFWPGVQAALAGLADAGPDAADASVGDVGDANAIDAIAGDSSSVDTGTTPPPPSSSGCKCTVIGAREDDVALLALASLSTLSLVLVSRRRRARRSRACAPDR